MFLAHVWYVFGMFLACFWYVFGMFLVCVWYVFGMFLVCFWYVLWGVHGGPPLICLGSSRLTNILSGGWLLHMLVCKLQYALLHPLMHWPSCLLWRPFSLEEVALVDVADEIANAEVVGRRRS